MMGLGQRVYLGVISVSIFVFSESDAQPTGSWWPGFATPPGGQGMNSQVAALAVHDGMLVAGGAFTQAGNRFANRIAQFDGAWHALGPGVDSWVFALLSVGSDLYVGGSFAMAGGSPTAHIARWDGGWHPVGTGLNGTVTTMGLYQGFVTAGGQFTEEGGNAGNRISLWDGNEWISLGSGLSGGAVAAIAEHQGDLYVGGSFTQAGASPVTGLARWNGSSWDDAGVAITPGQSGYVGPVEALCTNLNGNLLVGGDLTHINGLYVNGLAEWDGTTWFPRGIGLSDGAAIQELALYNGHVVAFGFFDGPGGSARVARWDGQNWFGLDSGVEPHWLFGDYGALTVHDDKVFVGGDIATAGGLPSEFIARWEDTSTSAAAAAALQSPMQLHRPYPNPMSEATMISYDLERPTFVALDVFNVGGQRIVNLYRGAQQPGRHAAHWNGRTRAGEMVPDGVYFIRLTGAQEVLSETVVLRRP